MGSGDGWSNGCATCWGNLEGCTAKSCLTKCLGGRTPGCVSCLKAAGCDKAAFGADSCTGFDAPSVTLLDAAAGKCTDADSSKWKADTNHAAWQKDMTSCGTKCLGRASCVSSCMAGDGWSTGCAGCFGDLAGCTAQHCLTKCVGGRTPGCVSCLKDAGCDKAAFGADSCTGFDAPSVTLLDAADGKCTDADSSKWKADTNHAAWQKDMTSCGTKCLGRASCVSSCMAGDGW